MGCERLNFYIILLFNQVPQWKWKKKLGDLHYNTTFFDNVKPVSTFTYFEKKTQFKFALASISALRKIEGSPVQWTCKI